MKIINTISILFFLNICFAQNQEIKIDNPSFENFPRAGSVPTGWVNCGFENESPPDTQPGWFGVETVPQNGQSYLGLVVRENESYESVGQKLESPLVAGECYSFEISLARSLIYLSPTRNSTTQVNHVTPVILRVWGGDGFCRKMELLAQTEAITSSVWVPYKFVFQPKTNSNFILFEAFFAKSYFPYNGNVLLDNLSDFQIVSCDSFDFESADFFVQNYSENPEGFDLGTYQMEVDKQKERAAEEQVKATKEKLAYKDKMKWEAKRKRNMSLVFASEGWKDVIYWEERDWFPKESKEAFRKIYGRLNQSFPTKKIIISIFGKEDEVKMRLKLWKKFVEKDKKIKDSRFSFEIIENPDAPIPWLGKNEFFGIRLE